MKKTLFAMAALALCGTAVAEDKYTNTLAPGSNVDLFGGTLHVNSEASLNNLQAFVDETPVTFKFYDLNTISITKELLLTSAAPSFNITGDEAAMNHWVSELTSSTGEVKSVTLMTFAKGSVNVDSAHKFSLDGYVSGATVTLGNAVLTYRGDYATIDQAKNAIGDNDNQIAVAFVTSGTGKGLYLVGKTTPATPEPATATLSLLALAGLATRRRRK